MNDRAFPADEMVDAWVAEQHCALVRDLAATLDLEAGIREATIPARHAALVADVNEVLDVEGGLSEISSGRLPTELPYEALLRAVRVGAGRIPFGLTETDLKPVYFDAATEPHLLVIGDADSGKSSFLRTVARGIVRMYEPAQALVILVDYRRSLVGCIESSHLIGYGTSTQIARGLIEQTAAAVRERLPRPGVTTEQLRDRSWWAGPELFVLVDDYDLVAGSTGPNPLAPLLDYLPLGRDVGLHLVVTGRVGGASQALFDPILRRMRDLGSPVIVLSGPREEDPLLGNVRPDHRLPGRGLLVTRRTGTKPVRLAWTPPGL